MVKDARNRRIRAILIVAAGSSVAFIANYIKQTTELLRNAFDPSIIDIFEDGKQPAYPNNYNKWITSKYSEVHGTFHQFHNFFRFTYAKRLMGLAKCDNQWYRVRAIHHLTNLKLEEWQCSIIAHMCDARAAIGIARSTDSLEKSKKFFLPPPRIYGTYNNQLLLHTIKDYMHSMYKDSKHRTAHTCLRKTISKIFLQAYDINRIIDSDHGTEALSYVGKESEDDLPLCLETVRHHSSISQYASDVLNEMGLYLLMEVHLRFPDDANINVPLCQIISNISMHPEHTQELFKTGWISVLAKWVHHPDVRIAGPANQALANLDKDTVKEKYSTNIFLLHPHARNDEKVLVDVVFVHGLLGSVFYTWRNGRNCTKTLDLVESIGLEESKFEDQNLLTASSDPAIQEYLQQMAEHDKIEWDHLGVDYEIVQFDIPEDTNATATGPYVVPHGDSCRGDENTQCWARDWLPVDCAHLRVLGVNYSTTLSLWAHMCPEIANNVTLEDRSTELMSELVDAGVGKRPIVWVAHSMGGLLVKNVISKALKSKDPAMQSLGNQSKAIFFYSTPHTGSKTAILNQTTSYLVWPSMDVQELREDSPNLRRIHNEFLDYLHRIPIRIFSFVENKPTIVSALKLNIEVVEKRSGNPGVGEYYEIPLNHLGICKPTNRQSFLYQKVLQEIRKVVAEEKEIYNKHYL
ncbi:protein SERAC1-like isoform X2 [Atheta coriaria]|uniref:protein SERAC1-like isoform X2 n=1 Tax=Dalotia coriaria TaxID=877792 RepID=UPI0031F3F263